MISKKSGFKHFNDHSIPFFLLFITVSFFSSCDGAGPRSATQADQKVKISDFINKVDVTTIPVAVFGGGSAGLTAAVYASQANLACTVFEGPKPGGALAQSHSVRNWPGVIDAPGAEIVGNIRKQAELGGVDIKQEKVISVDLSTRPFVIQTEDLNSGERKQYKALTCVIAMGSEPNYLGIPGETGPKGYWGRGVGNCAVCEGSLYKGKNVAVVGGGDAAIVEAGYLADIAEQVVVFVRKNHFRAKDMASRDRTLAKKNVKVVFNTKVTHVIGDESGVTHLGVENTTGKKETMPVDGLFLAIGSRPNSDLFKNQLEIDEQGFVVLKSDQETSVPGVYAAGDICEKHWVQAVRAADQGYIAAMQAKKFLETIGYDAVKIKKKKEEPGPQEEQKQEEQKIEETKELPDDRAKHFAHEITNANDLEKHIFQNPLPVVIDFYTTWCGPCQVMAPHIEKLAKELNGKVTFVKINLQAGPIDVDKFVKRIKGDKVKAVPTFVFVKNGSYTGKVVGGRSFEDFKTEVKNNCNIR